jgi:hypothetical protein
MRRQWYVNDDDENPDRIRYWRAGTVVVVLIVVSLLPELSGWLGMLRTGAIVAAVLLAIELIHRRLRQR